jgi:hypothetical protein
MHRSVAPGFLNVGTPNSRSRQLLEESPCHPWGVRGPQPRAVPHRRLPHPTIELADEGLSRVVECG